MRSTLKQVICHAEPDDALALQHHSYDETDELAHAVMALTVDDLSDMADSLHGTGAWDTDDDSAILATLC